MVDHARRKQTGIGTTSFRGQDLRGANFADRDVRGFDFSDADLRSSNFRGAKLGVSPRVGIALLGLAMMVAVVAGVAIGWGSTGSGIDSLRTSGTRWLRVARLLLY